MDSNGYLSAWVAQKAIIGQFDDAWATMLKSYDHVSTDGLINCSIDLSLSTALKALGQYGCPSGYSRRGTFPEGLAAFLVRYKYSTPDQSKSVGADVSGLTATRALNATWFDERMAWTW